MFYNPKEILDYYGSDTEPSIKFTYLNNYLPYFPSIGTVAEEKIQFADGLLEQGVITQDVYDSTVNEIVNANYIQSNDEEGGFVSSVVCRPLSDIDRGSGLGQSTIDDYRLMMFQLLDYRKENDIANTTDDGLGKYRVAIVINDTTGAQIKILIDKLMESISSFEEYYIMANDLCSYNKDTLKFNNFFSNYAVDYFSDLPESEYPWILAPYLYYLHLDIIYDTFNGSNEEIIKATQSIINQISPYDGNFSSLEELYTGLLSLRDRYNNLGDPIEEQSLRFFETIVPTSTQ
mgnify:CR=1 FL=1